MPDSGLLEAFVTYRPALLRYLSAQGATAEEAEDVVQDLGLKLTSDPPAEVGQPRAYLYRMAHNRFLLHRRSVARRQTREHAWNEARAGTLPDVDPAPSVEDHIAARQQLERLKVALAQLPDRTRGIFRRFRIEGVPRKQIAEEQGISVSAVEKHLARAYLAIATEIRALDEVSPDPRSLKTGRVDHGC